MNRNVFIVPLVCVLLVLGAITLHFSSPIAVSLRSGEPVECVILSSPPILVEYNPLMQKALVSFSARKSGAGTNSRAQEAAQVQQEFAKEGTPAALFYIVPPGDVPQSEMWQLIKGWIAEWKSSPLKFFSYVYAYAKSRAGNMCSLSVYDFVLMTMELTRLQMPDFAVASGQFLSQEGNSSDQAKPLVVEILNASSKKGIALKVTRYLRALNESGVQKVDVLRYDNYGKPENISILLDHTGRLNEVAELGKNLKLTSTEIVSSPKKGGSADVTLVIGEDLNMDGFAESGTK